MDVFFFVFLYIKNKYKNNEKDHDHYGYGCDRHHGYQLQGLEDHLHFRYLRTAERHLENDYDHLDKDGGGVHRCQKELTLLFNNLNFN